MHSKAIALRNKTKTILIIAVSILLTTIAVIGPNTNPAIVEARSLTDISAEIERLESEIDTNKNQISVLGAQAATLEGAVAGIESEIAVIQDEIELTELKLQELKLKLQETRAELERQKEILGKSLREHYKVGEITTVELFVSSDNFADFFNQKEYLSRVRSSVTESSQKVVALEEDLVKQETKQNQLLDQQEAQRGQAQAKRAEKQRLLEQTRGEQSRYTQLVSQNNEDLEAAKEEQRQIILASQRNRVVGGTGGYPWAGLEPWSMTGSKPDPWGMYTRQCVSYTAWKVNQDYLSGKSRYDMPYWGGGGTSWTGTGNAKYWDDIAIHYGVPTGTTPKAGAIAISEAGTWGHSMYVEAVNADGSIYVSQYNAGLAGEFSYATRSGAGLKYVYFQDW